MNKAKNNITIYAIIFAVLFYVLPLIAKFNYSKELLFTFLVLVNPIACIIISMVFGYRNGFSLMYLLVLAILFFPTIFIYYNSSAAYYGVLYFIFNFMGIMSGSFIKRTKDRIKENKL
ncbi:hypothetical protein [Metaclostridioides mangenotii]|uniref:K+-sensing histidine kinase KdpD n=1 Tax=Metaclostridioides mangenotii TaxID=1540 RepID=A0ABS4ECC3_9FIRM|nr:hypothetical protein [Clostridioides mangenotii]MBP1855574.1 K+-sensing histidine kinase KdpD [Clostridioides mangenotii]